MAEKQHLNISVIQAFTDGQQVVDIQLAAGSTIADAIDASGFDVPTDVAVGVFSKVAEPTQVLNDGDRVEIYRPLLDDPKRIRRRRAEMAAAKKAKA